MEDTYVLPTDLSLPIEYETYNNAKGLALIAKFIDKHLYCNHPCELNSITLDWEKSTYYPRLLTRKNAWINWDWKGDDIFRFCNAFDSPYPGARTLLNSQEVSLVSVKLDDMDLKHHPYCCGLIIRVSRNNNICWIAISNGSLKATVIPEGGVNRFVDLKPGDRFYTPHHKLVESIGRVHYSNQA